MRWNDICRHKIKRKNKQTNKQCFQVVTEWTVFVIRFQAWAEVWFRSYFVFHLEEVLGWLQLLKPMKRVSLNKICGCQKCWTKVRSIGYLSRILSRSFQLPLSRISLDWKRNKCSQNSDKIWWTSWSWRIYSGADLEERCREWAPPPPWNELRLSKISSILPKYTNN